VVVVGGGLAGLTAADALHRAGMSVCVIEARAAVGGRIRTLAPEGLGAGAWFDLGATWHWSDQPQVAALARELGVEAFPQFRDGQAMIDDPGVGPLPAAVDVPAPSPAELRFVGGAEVLCRRLAARLPAEGLLLGTEVTAIGREAGGVLVATDDEARGDVTARFAVVALPPRLAVQDIAFSPPLAADLVRVMRATPTWMAQAHKCVAVYESAFWRAEGRSGLAFSRAGPLTEVHDACTADGGVAGLWGFLSGDHAHRDLGFDERIPSVFAQLGRLFGAEAADPVQYFERDWSDDPYTNDEVVWVEEPLPYGDAAFARPTLDGRLFWAGAETSAVGGGHMEGAVRSGRRAAGAVLAAAGVGPVSGGTR
jgi:monoamine oxidase